MATQDSTIDLSFFKAALKFFLPNSQAIALAIILLVSFGLIYYFVRFTDARIYFDLSLPIYWKTRLVKPSA